MGCAEGDSHCKPDERPGRDVFLAAYQIDRTEVTVAEYRECVEALECSAPRSVGERDNWGKEGRDLHPVNAIHWRQAARYCAWAGKRLPTEAEWEKAARGADRRVYPWGNSRPSCRENIIMKSGGAGCGTEATWPVGSRPKGASPYDAQDMAGSVREWTADSYGPHDSAATKNPAVKNEEVEERVYKGGSFFQSRYDARVSRRFHSKLSVVNFDVGFRCAK